MEGVSKMKKIVILFFVVFCFADNLMAQEIKLVAMNSFQPFVISDSNSQATGIAVTVVNQLFLKAGINVDPVSLYPLKRMIIMVSETPNTFGFPIFRTPEREKSYKWVVPVTLPIRSVLVKLKSRNDISVNILEEAKKYSIGVVNGNNLQTLLNQAGFSKVDPVTTNEQNYKKLFARRVDLIAIREPTLMTELKQTGLSTDDVAIAFSFGDDSPGWLITNLQTPDDVITKLKKAYEVIKNDQLIEKVTKEYY